MALTLAATELLDAGTEPARRQGGAPARAEIDALTLEQCREGEPQALRRFVLCYQRALFAFLGRTVGRGPHVEDLAQEVFIRAYRALPRFERREGVRVSTWLLKIAVRLVSDERRRPRRLLVPLSDDLPANDELGPEGRHHVGDIGRAVEGALGELPDEQRVVFVLAHFNGLSMAEIAAMTGVPEGTVKTRLFRAHARLRSLLSDVWEALP
ncbi:MAG: sigma-70 family RNA polymerase sigma factor [Polyangiaceae bacterium]|nr:sigma-70 family RNA polymerase sigma factor [Polyangiaceae bacterium]